MSKSGSTKFYENIWFQLAAGYLVLSPIGSGVYDNTKKIPIITPILGAFKFVWNVVLDFNVPLYLVLIIATIAVFFTRNHFIFKEKSREIEVPNAPFLSYTEGVLKVWKWKWTYRFDNFENKYRIEDLTPICEVCDIKMLNYGYYNSYRCPKCNKYYATAYQSWENKTDIEALIIDNIEKGNYPK
jgi:hypothetical protein